MDLLYLSAGRNDVTEIVTFLVVLYFNAIGVDLNCLDELWKIYKNKKIKGLYWCTDQFFFGLICLDSN